MDATMVLRFGARRLEADGGHLVFATLLTAFVVWYSYDVYRVATHLADFLLIFPGTILTVALYVLIAIREIRVVPVAETTRLKVPRAERGLLIKQWVYIAAMAGFLVLTPYIGVEAATFLFTIGMLRLLGSRNWAVDLVLPTAFALALSYVFVEVLKVPLPSLLFDVV